ncbi:MAG: PilZ domain-containing protein [Candidatus Omnitrophota bacterium]
MFKSPTERRYYPRIECSFPVTIRGEGFTLIIETKNISCSGLYCKTNETGLLKGEVRVILLLNRSRSSRITVWPKVIDCIGVIVRIESAEPGDGFGNSGVAIQFKELSKDNKNNISNCVSQWRNYR